MTAENNGKLRNDYGTKYLAEGPDTVLPMLTSVLDRSKVLATELKPGSNETQRSEYEVPPTVCITMLF